MNETGDKMLMYCLIVTLVFVAIYLLFCKSCEQRDNFVTHDKLMDKYENKSSPTTNDMYIDVDANEQALDYYYEHDNEPNRIDNTHTMQKFASINDCRL